MEYLNGLLSNDRWATNDRLCISIHVRSNRCPIYYSIAYDATIYSRSSNDSRSYEIVMIGIGDICMRIAKSIDDCCGSRAMKWDVLLSINFIGSID